MISSNVSLRFKATVEVKISPAMFFYPVVMWTLQTNNTGGAECRVRAQVELDEQLDVGAREFLVLGGRAHTKEAKVEPCRDSRTADVQLRIGTRLIRVRGV